MKYTGWCQNDCSVRRGRLEGAVQWAGGDGGTVAWRRIADPNGVRDPLPVRGAKRPQYRWQYFWIVVFLASWGAILLSIVLKLKQAKTQQEDKVFSTKE